MNWLLTHQDQIFAIVGQVVLAASGIVAVTPSTRDDKVVGKVVKFVELFSIFNKRTK